MDRRTPEDEANTVESAFFPGALVPVDVEKSLAELLSLETLRWIDAHDAAGHADEGGCYGGKYISPDMKEVIRGFVEKYPPSENPEPTGPLMDPSRRHHERGTDVGSPFYDPQKRRPLHHDCQAKRPPGSMSLFLVSLEKWMRQWMEGLLCKEVLFLRLSLVIVVMSVAALLFVYGVSDVCNGILTQWQSSKHFLAKLRTPRQVQLPEKREESCPTEKQNHTKTTTRHTTRLKTRESYFHGKSSVKKRSKVHTKARNETPEVKKEAKAVGRHETASVRDASEEGDANNEWQEVMHNKPKGRVPRIKQEEEKIFPVPKKAVPSQPSTPQTPELQPPPPAAPQNSEMTPAMKPIKTRIQDVAKPEPLGEPAVGLKLTMTTSGAFSDETMPSSGGLEFCPMPQQTPLGRSPFAASMDLPFSSSYTAHPTEEQFQTKIDCLLRNLRNKPFSAYPVTQSPFHPLRRAVRELEEQMFPQRRSPQQLPLSFSGSLDPSLSLSSSLNNRVCFPHGYPLSEDMSRPLAGMQPVGFHSRQQRAGSLPLTPSHTQAFFPLHRQSSMSGTMKNVPPLSNDCSLFSPNPSIWSPDLEVDHDFVKSSMANNGRFQSVATSPTGVHNYDLKYCLPDQLLSEVTYPDS